MTYPDYTGPAPVYNAVQDGWTNLSGRDSMRYRSHNSNGQPTQIANGRNQVINLSNNDAERQLTSVQYVPVNAAVRVNYFYDEVYGRLERVTQGTDRYTYSYNDGDRLTGQEVTYTGVPAKSLTYSYYPDGSRAGRFWCTIKRNTSVSLLIIF